MNRGTSEGDLYEAFFVSNFNANKHMYASYFKSLNIDDYANYYMVRVTSKQLSRLSGKKVMARADAFLIKIHDKIELTTMNLSEDLLRESVFDFTKVHYSGISIKHVDSSKYQILKLTPGSFFALLGNRELGAGASIYCDKEEDLHKNEAILSGWSTSWDKLSLEFNTPQLSANITDRDVLKNIKTIANAKIAHLIESSDEISKKVFNGIGLYDEPYTAHYFFQNKKIVNLQKIPFTVTTGSGRSRGDYTIVLKPIGQPIATL